MPTQSPAKPRKLEEMSHGRRGQFLFYREQLSLPEDYNPRKKFKGIRELADSILAGTNDETVGLQNPNARNLLLGLRPLREPMARPEAGKRGLTGGGEKGVAAFLFCHRISGVGSMRMNALRGFFLLLPIFCFTHASAALVYSQNFNAATEGTTGTGLGDGSNIVTSTPGAGTVQEWGSLKALHMTKEGIGGTASNFFLPDLNPGGAVTSFSVSFDLLFQSTDTSYADGISFNFGQLNSTTQTYGSEFGMFNPSFTGDVLSVGWVNYWGGNKRIEVYQNGATVSSNTTYPPFTSVQSSIPGPTVPVTVSWDQGSGLSLTYGGSNVFTNLATPGFTPAAGYKFAFAARTGDDTQDTFIDNIQVNTVPEPAATLLGALGFLGLLRRRR